MNTYPCQLALYLAKKTNQHPGHVAHLVWGDIPPGHSRYVTKEELEGIVKEWLGSIPTDTNLKSGKVVR